jgi:hypothetical protein
MKCLGPSCGRRSVRLNARKNLLVSIALDRRRKLTAIDGRKGCLPPTSAVSRRFGLSFGTKTEVGGLFHMPHPTLPATVFKSPAIALSGVVDYDMYTKFRTQFDNASDENIVVIELFTLGSDPEVARMMGEDVRFASEMEPARRFVFFW